MMRQKMKTILGGVLAFACVANAALAQTAATTNGGTQMSANEGQSAAAMAQEASNPFASNWALQLQQNNNWTEMPRGDDHTRVQSNLRADCERMGRFSWRGGRSWISVTDAGRPST
jgi:hypothetical protein